MERMECSSGGREGDIFGIEVGDGRRVRWRFTVLPDWEDIDYHKDETEMTSSSIPLQGLVNTRRHIGVGNGNSKGFYCW